MSDLKQPLIQKNASQERSLRPVMNAFAANLRCLFAPESVAVIGASDKPDKLGFHVMKSLTKGGFGDRIIPVIGPNTFGMINSHANLNASFTPEFSRIKKGGISLVSQSGGISHLLGFMAMGMDVGFSKIVGLGNRLNVDFPQMLDYLMNDADTKVIVLYVEGVDDPRDFIEAAKKYPDKKPVIAYKTGSSMVGDQASLSHTGSMAGRHEVYAGAFSQAGILSTDNTETLLDTAKAMVNLWKYRNMSKRLQVPGSEVPG